MVKGKTVECLTDVVGRAKMWDADRSMYDDLRWMDIGQYQLRELVFYAYGC